MSVSMRREVGKKFVGEFKKGASKIYKVSTFKIRF